MIRALGQRFRTAATIFLRASTAPRAASPLTGAKLSPKRYRTGKGKQRQVTVAAIKAVKETPFLMAVQGVVGGIQIDDDLQAILGQAARTHPQKGILDRLMVGADLMTTGIFIVAKFEPVERRGAGQRLALILGSAS